MQVSIFLCKAKVPLTPCASLLWWICSSQRESARCCRSNMRTWGAYADAVISGTQSTALCCPFALCRSPFVEGKLWCALHTLACPAPAPLGPGASPSDWCTVDVPRACPPFVCRRVGLDTFIDAFVKDQFLPSVRADSPGAGRGRPCPVSTVSCYCFCWLEEDHAKKKKKKKRQHEGCLVPLGPCPCSSVPDPVLLLIWLLSPGPSALRPACRGRGPAELQPRSAGSPSAPGPSGQWRPSQGESHPNPGSDPESYLCDWSTSQTLNPQPSAGCTRQPRTAEGLVLGVVLMSGAPSEEHRSKADEF